MTDIPPQKKPTRSKAKPKTDAKRQVDLPLVETPPPAPPPAITAPPALADRAARYNRHRSPLDDRPLTQQGVTAPPPPRPVLPTRPYVNRHLPEPPATEAPKVDARPKNLDMAAIAARNRQARDAARDERPVAAPIPVQANRPRTERLVPVPVKPVPERPRDDSMLARAARHNTLLRDEQERTQALAQKPVEVKTPVPQRQKPQPDEQSMVERAADATKRRRDAVGGPLQATTTEEMVSPPLHLATTAFVLVSRNDGGRVTDRLHAWRALVEAPDVRWWLLDLGSVDESIAHAEAAHAQVVLVPGGAVAPMATLAALLRRVDADTILIADADALPDRRSLRVLADVRAGKKVAAAPADRPGVLAIDRTAWQAEGFGRAVDLQAWSQRALPGKSPLLQATGAFVPRLLHAPQAEQLLARALPVIKRLRSLLKR